MATGDYTQPKYEGYPPGIAGTFSGDSAARIVEVPLEYAVDEVITDHLIFRGAGRLIPANGVTLELQGGYSAHDYQHVFDISSGGAVVGLQANYVTPWHFGATAEGNSGDDTAAINAAIQYATLAQVRDEYATGHRVVFPPVPLITRGYYYITSDIVVNRNVIIEGNAPAGSLLGAVRVVAADTCDAAFWFASPGGLSAVEPYTSEVGANFWGAGRSVMRHFLIEPENPGGVNFGIIHNVPVHFYDITCHEFDLANFFAHAHTSGNSDYGTPIGTTGAGTMHGNADQSLYEKCLANACQNGHGFAAKGNDAQIMLYLNCDAKVNNGSGFWDGSAIGNVYMNCHTTGNTVKVLNNGTYYMCITEHTASALNEPGVGAEWEEYWVEITATTEDTAWTTATFYRGCGAINVANRAALTTIIGHYTEGGIEKGIIPGNSTMIFGGQAVANGRIVRHPNIGGATVVGSALSNSPSHWKHVNDADEEYGSALGSRSGYGSPEFFTFGHSNDSAQAPSIWKLRWNDTRNQYGYSREGGNDVFGLTGADFSQDGYSGAEHVIVPNGLLIGDDSGATPRYARIRSIQNNSAISGVVVRGDIFYYTEPVAGGKIGAVVVTAGTVGSDAVVKEFGVIDA